MLGVTSPIADVLHKNHLTPETLDGKPNLHSFLTVANRYREDAAKLHWQVVVEQGVAYLVGGVGAYAYHDSAPKFANMLIFTFDNAELNKKLAEYCSVGANGVLNGFFFARKISEWLDKYITLYPDEREAYEFLKEQTSSGVFWSKKALAGVMSALSAFPYISIVDNTALKAAVGVSYTFLHLNAMENGVFPAVAEFASWFSKTGDVNFSADFAMLPPKKQLKKVNAKLAEVEKEINALKEQWQKTLANGMTKIKKGQTKAEATELFQEIMALRGAEVDASAITSIYIAKKYLEIIAWRLRVQDQIPNLNKLVEQMSASNNPLYWEVNIFPKIKSILENNGANSIEDYQQINRHLKQIIDLNTSVETLDGLIRFVSIELGANRNVTEERHRKETVKLLKLLRKQRAAQPEALAEEADPHAAFVKTFYNAVMKFTTPNLPIITPGENGDGSTSGDELLTEDSDDVDRLVAAVTAVNEEIYVDLLNSADEVFENKQKILKQLQSELNRQLPAEQDRTTKLAELLETVMQPILTKADMVDIKRRLKHYRGNVFDQATYNTLIQQLDVTQSFTSVYAASMYTKQQVFKTKCDAVKLLVNSFKTYLRKQSEEEYFPELNSAAIPENEADFWDRIINAIPVIFMDAEDNFGTSHLQKFLRKFTASKFNQAEVVHGIEHFASSSIISTKDKATLLHQAEVIAKENKDLGVKVRGDKKALQLMLTFQLLRDISQAAGIPDAEAMELCRDLSSLINARPTDTLENIIERFQASATAKGLRQDLIAEAVALLNTINGAAGLSKENIDSVVRQIKAYYIKAEIDAEKAKAVGNTLKWVSRAILTLGTYESVTGYWYSIVQLVANNFENKTPNHAMQWDDYFGGSFFFFAFAALIALVGFSDADDINKYIRNPRKILEDILYFEDGKPTTKTLLAILYYLSTLGVTYFSTATSLGLNAVFLERFNMARKGVQIYNIVATIFTMVVNFFPYPTVLDSLKNLFETYVEGSFDPELLEKIKLEAFVGKTGALIKEMSAERFLGLLKEIIQLHVESAGSQAAVTIVEETGAGTSMRRSAEAGPADAPATASLSQALAAAEAEFEAMFGGLNFKLFTDKAPVVKAPAVPAATERTGLLAAERAVVAPVDASVEKGFVEHIAELSQQYDALKATQAMLEAYIKGSPKEIPVTQVAIDAINSLGLFAPKPVDAFAEELRAAAAAAATTVEPEAAGARMS